MELQIKQPMAPVKKTNHGHLGIELFISTIDGLRIMSPIRDSSSRINIETTEPLTFGTVAMACS